MFLIIENNLDDLFTFVELAFHKLLKNTSHKVKTIIIRFYNSDKDFSTEKYFFQISYEYTDVVISCSTGIQFNPHTVGILNSKGSRLDNS